MAKKIKSPLLVTGNMRSGTTWMHFALKSIGMDIEHECFGADGTVSWFFALDWKWYPTQPNAAPRGRTAHVGEGRRRDYEFDHVVHLVRNPLKTIGSMTAIMRRVEQEWLAEMGAIDLETKPKMLRMMHIWDFINTRIAEDGYDLRVAIERMEDGDWDKLMRLIGRRGTPYPNIPVKNASRGIFKARECTWDTLNELDPILTKRIYAKAKRYGYE